MDRNDDHCPSLRPWDTHALASLLLQALSELPRLLVGLCALLFQLLVAQWIANAPGELER